MPQSELLKFAKLFNDELTLDNLERCAFGGGGGEGGAGRGRLAARCLAAALPDALLSTPPPPPPPPPRRVQLVSLCRFVGIQPFGTGGWWVMMRRGRGAGGGEEGMRCCSGACLAPNAPLPPPCRHLPARPAAGAPPGDQGVHAEKQRGGGWRGGVHVPRVCASRSKGRARAGLR